MNEMLFIDGESVDIGEGTEITLKYNSNLFKELGKIVGDNSYTIKLPKTVRNMRLIGNADAPASDSGFPRVYHACRYFRNGVEVVSDGRAVLMSVGDDIEIVMTWGSTTGFAAMVEDGKTLDEVAERDDWIEYAPIANPNGYKTSYGIEGVAFVDIDFGLKADEELAAPHASVRSEYILNLLRSVYGVTFEFPADRQAVIDSLVFPLLTRNGGYANMLASKIGLEYVTYEHLGQMLERWKLTGQGDDAAEYLKTYGFNEYGVVYANSFEALKDLTVIVKVNVKSRAPFFSIEYGNDTAMTLQTFPYSVGSDGLYVFDTFVEIDLMEGDYIQHIDTTNVDKRVSGTIEISAKPTEVAVGDRYPIVENLPSIKTVDFIKAIASMLNMFAVPNEDGSVIKFVSVDTLGDTSRAVDWSDKLIAHTRENKPKEVSYTLDDFARNNRLTYKDDDTVLRRYKNGNVTVNDETLDFERDAVDLPFAATDMLGGRAKIALYMYNDDGEPELQDVEPRVLVETNVNGYSTGSFVGLSWGELVEKYYGTYQKIVASPVVIADKFLLNDIELRDLDVTKPVYLRQYGRYFAIVEVKAPKTGVCECKLLELDI